ncbi:MAG: alpha/beta fold hydrolase [Brevundimonas sp.]
MNVLTRNNVRIAGTSPHHLIFAHGFGCDQSMWRRVVAGLSDRHTVVLFDHVGSGDSDWSAYDATRHGSLTGYAADLVEICENLPPGNVTFVGHSVGATIGILAANQRPDLIQSLVLICPSPRFSNTDDYVGGFAPSDITELLDLMDKNHLDWSALMAPTVIGAQDIPEQDEWRNSVCRIDPAIAKQFARVTFEADNRTDFAANTTPALVIDCSEDSLAPPSVGDFLARVMPASRRVTLQASGHCPHLTRASDVVAAIEAFADERRSVDIAA